MIKYFTLLLLCALQLTSYAQKATPKLNIGSAAPQLRVRAWLKGTPVTKFEKGKVYVMEFWATWCHPCKVAMPHLSALADKYRDKVVFTGVDVYETKTTTRQQVQHFVEVWAAAWVIT